MCPYCNFYSLFPFFLPGWGMQAKQMLTLSELGYWVLVVSRGVLKTIFWVLCFFMPPSNNVDPPIEWGGHYWPCRKFFETLENSLIYGRWMGEATPGFYRKEWPYMFDIWCLSCGCLEGVWMVSGGCLEGVWRVLEGVWRVSGSNIWDFKLVCVVSRCIWRAIQDWLSLDRSSLDRSSQDRSSQDRLSQERSS